MRQLDRPPYSSPNHLSHALNFQYIGSIRDAIHGEQTDDDVCDYHTQTSALHLYLHLTLQTHLPLLRFPQYSRV